MASKLTELAERRAQLQARSEAQRVLLAKYHARIGKPLELVEMALGAVTLLRRSPLMVTGVAALLTKTPWRKLAHFPKLAWRGWKIIQFVKNWTQKRA